MTTPTRLGTGAALASALLLTLTTTSAPSTAAPADRGSTPVITSAASAPTTHQVTLITGDVVSVTTTADGRTSVEVVSGPASSGQFQALSTPTGDTYVYPAGATAAIASDTVDAELFNVTRLIADGYADAETSRLPVIVDFRGKPDREALSRQAKSLPASTHERSLPRLGLVTLDVTKARAADLWKQVGPRSRPGEVGQRSIAPGRAGITKIWYDGIVEVALEKSVPQIGAPEAWAAGYDGTGTTVAILDTGADSSHPDIAESIVALESFVPDETAQDGHGHGTHVASTIAGSGAASGGTHKGVAPGADLVIGKVLGDEGSGDASGILAGMEWAVGQGADVVNMSLGGADFPGPDALEIAVDTLSQSSDTLFVVAAGNAGPRPGTLGTPGVAEAALTVGAVDGSDRLAGFSSRGPRLDDAGVKPDVTAPGVAITAARAAGTTMGTPLDASYTSASGTSMATPHVAGAAALLAQRHPEWGGERIKDALRAHTVLADGPTPYEQGTGRISVVRALDPVIELTGTATFGEIAWQEGDNEPVTRELTYRNSSDTPVVLDLAASVVGGPLPTGLVTFGSESLSGDQLTVPAQGTAVVTVTLEPDALAPGDNPSGYVTATDAQGAAVRTPFAVRRALETHDLEIKAFDRRGGHDGMVTLAAVSLEDHSSRSLMEPILPEGNTLALPTGRYAVYGGIGTIVPGDWNFITAVDLFGSAELDLSSDTVVTLDARDGVNTDLTLSGTDRRVEAGATSTALGVENDGRRTAGTGTFGLRNGSEFESGVLPFGESNGDGVILSHAETLREPVSELTITSGRNVVVPTTVAVGRAPAPGKLTLPLVDAGTSTPEEIAGLELAGKAVLVSGDTTGTSHPIRVARDGGASMLIVADTASDVLGLTAARGVDLPVVLTDSDGADLLRARLGEGAVKVSLREKLDSSYAYSTLFEVTGSQLTSPVRTVDASEFTAVRNRTHTDGEGHVGMHTLASWGPGLPTAYRASQYNWAGSERVDHVWARQDQQHAWTAYADTSGLRRMYGPVRPYPEAGGEQVHTWFAAPLRISESSGAVCNFCRIDQGVVLAGVPRDAGPGNQLMLDGTVSWSGFRDGQQVEGLGELFVPERSDYRIVHDYARKEPSKGVRLAGHIHTEWAFTSAAPSEMAVPGCDTQFETTTCETMPVVLIDYDLDVDLENRAPRRPSLVIHGERAAGWNGSTHMAGATLEVSYDDGATWHEAGLRRVDENSFAADYRHPRNPASEFVTLRTSIWDGEGDRTTQTITRAYLTR